LSTPSIKFESVLAKHPSLRERLIALATYVAKEVDAGHRDIVPALAARALRVSEAEILGFLMLFEEQGLLTHVYQVYCAGKKTFLGEFESKKQIPDSIPCQFCDKDHCDPDELEIELVFRLVDVSWLPNVHHHNAAVA